MLIFLLVTSIMLLGWAAIDLFAAAGCFFDALIFGPAILLIYYVQRWQQQRKEKNFSRLVRKYRYGRNSP